MSITSTLAKAKSLLSCRKGVSAVEFALCAPFLMICMIIAVDLGTGILQSIEVTSAARAATQYGSVRRPVAGDFSMIEQAALDALTNGDGIHDISSVAVAATLECECSGGSGSGCGSTCDTGEFREAYLTVSVTKDWEPLVPYPGVTWPIQLTGQSVMRLQ